MTGSQGPLHIETPLIPSAAFSKRSGCQVFLKLDNLQPSGSFKCRGVSAEAVSLCRERGPGARLVISSGGNAGLACAYAASRLGVPCSVYVPVTTTADMVARLRALGAEVIQGSNWPSWQQADDAARAAVAEDPKAAYVHPFDNADLVKGHATLIDEVDRDLKALGVDRPPEAVLCSVGGGGLLSGIIQGVQSRKWPDTTLLASETIGAASFNASVVASYASSPPQRTIKTLPAITSLASTLGAVTVATRVVDATLERNAAGGQGKVVSMTIEDGAAVAAVQAFIDEHFMLVELSCGTALVPLMTPSALQAALPAEVASRVGHADPAKRPVVVVVVCGGNLVSIDKLRSWKEKFGIGEAVGYGQPPTDQAFEWTVFDGHGTQRAGREALV